MIAAICAVLLFCFGLGSFSFLPIARITACPLSSYPTKCATFPCTGPRMPCFNLPIN